MCMTEAVIVVTSRSARAHTPKVGSEMTAIDGPVNTSAMSGWPRVWRGISVRNTVAWAGSVSSASSSAASMSSSNSGVRRRVALRTSTLTS